MDLLDQRPRQKRAFTARRAFSIVELLVVIAIIIALLGTLLAALSLAGRRAQSAQTQTFLTSISSALAALERDIGYLPPVLGAEPWLNETPNVGNARDYVLPPAWNLGPGGTPSSASVNALQQYYSYTTLPEYLVGYGDRTLDGHGAFGPLPATPAGSPGARESILGIRHPGDDGFWNGLLNPRSPAQQGRLGGRNIVEVTGAYNANNVNPVALQGKVFGPYIQLTDSTNLGAIKSFDANGEPVIVLAGEDPNYEILPKVFVDYWGSPIAYYRRPYVAPDLKANEQWGSGVLGRDLGDIFALRPAEFKAGEDLTGVADANGDNSTLGRLKAASFALLSRGADKSIDRTIRRDANGFNSDNIVEVGQ